MRYGRTGLANWTHPLVTLSVYPVGVELRSTFRWMRPFVPIWRARYADLAEVQSVGRAESDAAASRNGSVQARGVRFVARDDSYRIFWCYDRDAVLSSLDRTQVRIEMRPEPFRFFHP